MNPAELIKGDEELLYARSTDAIRFIHLYKKSYDDFKKKFYTRAIKNIKNAMGYRKDDLLCQYMYKCIKKTSILTQKTLAINFNA
jgi:hypothetical protein